MQRTPHSDIEELTRDAVRDSFQKMFEIELKEATLTPMLNPEGGHIVASVGFIGEATGLICINSSVGLAKTIASRLLGIPEPELDDVGMVNDVFSELGNVVVGSVQSRLCDRGWPCTLTIPSIVRGNQLSVEAVAESTRINLSFYAGRHLLNIEISVKNPEAASVPKTTRILTVDDSKTVRMIVGKAFKRFDCSIFEAADGAEGLLVAERERPDIIILDYTMPVLDGGEAMTQLMANPELKTIPVVMLTAESGRDTMARMARLGVRDYLVKPFKEEVLVECVGRIVPLNAKASSAAPAPVLVGAGSGLRKDF